MPHAAPPTRVLKFRVWDRERRCWRRPESLALDFIGGVAEVSALFFDDFPEEKGVAFMPDDERFAVLWFTGLCDAAGVEMYEGDVLEYTWGPAKSRGVVEWIGNGFWIRGENDANHLPNKNLRRVVGNLYEPAEALSDAR